MYEFIGMLIDRQQKIISAKSKLMAESFSRLLTELVVIFIFVLFSGVIIAHFTIRSIVKPVKFLKRILLYLGKGIFPTTTIGTADFQILDGFLRYEFFLQRTKAENNTVKGDNR